jgi:hypothetical protein
MSLEKLNTLAGRVRGGDARAASELREALSSPLARIVRRALRPGTRTDPLVRLIRAEAGPVGHRRGEPEPGVESEVAQDICDAIVGDLYYGTRPRHPARETVVA